MKKYWLGSFLLIPFVLSGCGANGSAPAELRGIASAYLAGKAFDDVRMSLNQENDAKLARAGSEFTRTFAASGGKSQTLYLIAGITQEAGQLSAAADLLQGEESAEVRNRSDRTYRLALAFVSGLQSLKGLDSTTLNGMGYFLADRGQSKDEFNAAVVLTKAALDAFPKVSGRNAMTAQVARAEGPQDSYAWALFKAGRFEEARVQQEEALSIVRSMDMDNSTADLPFHMAEIYRSVGEVEKARREYEIALLMAKDPNLKGRIRFGIQALVLRDI